MIVNNATLAEIRVGFSTLFNQALQAATPTWDKVATMAPSTSAQNNYKWLGAFPMLRKWIGDRYIKSLEALGYSIVNEDYEATVEVDKNDIEDDNLGVFRPVIQALGQNAAIHPDSLVFTALKDGFTKDCYDGQFFFDTDHPVGDGTVSNDGGGGGSPWFLLDTSKFIKPIIYQERKSPEFVSMEDAKDESVFKRRKFLYGVDYRGAVGYALWQLAYGSKDTLDTTNYEAAFQALQEFKDDEGVPLGITPTLLVVAPANRSKALALLKAERLASGATNVNQDTAELMVVPWLA